MTTLPQMGLVLPERGATGSGEWHDTLDADLTRVDSHRHVVGEGTAIPTAGISLDADLTFGGLYAPIHLHRITFDSITALTGDNKSLFVNTSDNELYWRSNAGTNVKLTSGAALNVAAFTGGIGGDYASVGAAVAYDDAADRYTFKQQSGTWARLACGPVRIFEFNTSESVYVEHAVAAGLAVSYTLTWPTSPDPTSSGVKRVLTVDPSGNVSTMPSGPAGVMYPIQLAIPGAGTTLTSSLALGTSVASNYLPIPLAIGGTISAWTVWIQKTSAAGTISCQLEFLNGTNGATTTSGAAATNSANNPGFITLTITGLSGTLAAGTSARLNLTGGGTTGDLVFGYSAVWT